MNYLLINLAVADMMVALFVAPRFLLSHSFTHPAGATGTLLCKLLTGGNLTWIGGAASVFTLVAIAFERYYAVMHPYRIRGKLTYGKLKVCVCVFVCLRKKGSNSVQILWYCNRNSSEKWKHKRTGNFLPDG